ncbi:hypothetical protein [Myceligenerans pegani]|uniref:Pp24 protein n=1 Tax=Myceligenerans pegani TaxID=2776917 RepID=A0ABR9N6X7_9MICO|nr:hypothetical protein [Myceligenerans sp. TRM 65318]MBE1878919.1 hypothetical protein [Myceligenerans sp. TRM 65318]MBE3021190.1 hypothetical protein [Myceligenerans sp. TRM 65318]
MTDQLGYDPVEDPDADPDQLNPRTGVAASGAADESPDPRTEEDEPDQDADPASLNPRTGRHARSES